VQEVTMARPTRSQPGLFDPAPPPIRLPWPLRADAVALLRILLGEAVAPTLATTRTAAAGEVADDDPDHV
jgi:hypothetical protein